MIVKITLFIKTQNVYVVYASASLTIFPDSQFSATSQLDSHGQEEYNQSIPQTETSESMNLKILSLLLLVSRSISEKQQQIKMSFQTQK